MRHLPLFPTSGTAPLKPSSVWDTRPGPGEDLGRGDVLGELCRISVVPWKDALLEEGGSRVGLTGKRSHTVGSTYVILEFLSISGSV